MKNYIRILGIFMFAASLTFMTCSDNGGSESGGGPTVVTMAAIAGVIPPVIGAAPVTSITETAQYTGIIAWDGSWSGTHTFAGSKAYTATITLTTKPGFTLTGVTANYFTVTGTTTVSNPANSGVITAVFPVTVAVSIGDTILGGNVAYILQSGDPGYVDGEQRGLIAATADQDGGSGIIWVISAYQSTAITGTGITIGTGSSNTDKIIAQNGADSTYAAGLARAYNGSGYTDWYLPSQDELNKLYDNSVAIGGFVGYYWSSSEVSNELAWDQDFANGHTHGSYKDNTFHVRAVRDF